MQRTTSFVRFETDITFNADKTPAQIATLINQLKTRLDGLAGVTVGNVSITSYAPNDFSGWNNQP